ncbi:MAG: uracil-DNA glycosylase [Methylovulum sp.]|uniref:uracil-DNA glycosylase n=1 Tax=Methylovulum sp. TaxID=1916980 RepID=UPI0026217463|nr:uracil-DNA glycosylase [Methylovulum sp.]MDD2723051.1 uracil-DNA glycosylase [Methylovulum sp.]MDD5123760.1 uracil-DNA glycosylase [Methylovulum sp.]
MDNALRLQYLDAMGIDVWIPRHLAPSHLELPSVAITSCVETRPESVPVSDDWDTLAAEVAACTRCGLCSTRKNTVFGSGNKNADWLFIGEGPGQHEDEQGLPFVGNAGQLLTEMIRAIGLGREDVFITNIVKCRPPNNRDPHADEVAGCHDYLQRQIALIQPKIILAVGRIAAQTLLGTDAPLSKLRGRVHNVNSIPVIVIYHPAYLLRSLLEKRKAWQDLQFAIKTLQKQ